MADPLWLEETRPCSDPECVDEHGKPGRMEPEEDGDLRYFACTLCFREDGYERIQTDVQGCQLGVPLEIRQRAQTPAPKGAPVPISIGRRPSS